MKFLVKIRKIIKWSLISFVIIPIGVIALKVTTNINIVRNITVFITKNTPPTFITTIIKTLDGVPIVYEPKIVVRWPDTPPYGYVDGKNNIIVRRIYDDGDKYFQDNRAAVQKNDLWGFINKTGREIVALEYYQARSFSNGRACVKGISDLFGYLDKDGKIVIDLEFEEASDFNKHGEARVKKWVPEDKRSRYCLIDSNGEMIGTTYYDDKHFWHRENK